MNAKSNYFACVRELAELVKSSNPEHVAKAILEFGWQFAELEERTMVDGFKEQLEHYQPKK